MPLVHRCASKFIYSGTEVAAWLGAKWSTGRSTWDLVSEQITVGEERFNLISLRADDPVAPSPIPPLYEPVLLGFFTLAFRLRGFESVNRGTSSFGVVQEWHCEVPE
jgi:hypothetical protein